MADFLYNLLKGTVYLVFFAVVLIVGLLVYWVKEDVRQSNELEELCATANDGGSVGLFLETAASPDFKVRKGGVDGKDEAEWFDREYLRIGNYMQNTIEVPLDYAVVFAKPGLGYYACIVTHDDDLIVTANFEDRSS